MPTDLQGVFIDYTNHRGERRRRHVLPLGDMEFTSNEWHPVRQWLMTALDLERSDGVARTFALKNVHSWEPARASQDEISRRVRVLRSHLVALPDDIKMEPLGAEFEAVYDSNTEKLYMRDVVAAASDEIGNLRAENKRLREALTYVQGAAVDAQRATMPNTPAWERLDDVLALVRNALSGKKE